MNAIDRLLLMLETISETLQRSKQSELQMYKWHRGSLHPNPLDTCLLGEQALQKNYKLFPPHDFDALESYATDISDTLEEAFGEVFKSYDLAYSLYSASYQLRLASATDYFSQEEIESFNHLNKEFPTPQDAVMYIDAVIEKVKACS